MIFGNRLGTRGTQNFRNRAKLIKMHKILNNSVPIKYPIREAIVQVYTTCNGKTLKIIFIWKNVFEYN